MRFSQGVLKSYYRIQLIQDRAETVDALFTLAAHSLRRYEEATTLRKSVFAQYHLDLYRRAFRQMLNEIYRFGDFSDACDPIEEGLGKRERWNPIRIPHSLVGTAIFDAIEADWRFPLGYRHSNQGFLDDDDAWEAA